MKYTLFSILLSLFSFVTCGQSLQNTALSCEKGWRVCTVPDNWTIEGVTSRAYSYNESVGSLFQTADSSDVFFSFFSNTLGQWGGFSQNVKGIEAHKEYCLSFEAAVSRPWKPATTIDFELYLGDKLYDSETFIYPTDSSKIVDLCFISPTIVDGKKLLLRTNNLVGLTTYVIIKAGSGNFYENQTTSSPYTSFSNEINISPNPTTGILSIELIENLSDFKIAVYSVNGVKQFEEKRHNSANIDISFLEAGFYYLEIISENKRHIEKVILSKY